MGIVWTIIIGFIAGVIAKFIMPGSSNEPSGFILTTILGIVGRDGGYTASVADACVVVPTVNAATVTPHTEAFQAIIWHLLVSHPAIKVAETKWESSAQPSSSTATV